MHHLDKILAVPVWNLAQLCDDTSATVEANTVFYCLNCNSKLKIKKPEDLIRWRKCPTCGFCFIDKQYYSTDEFINNEVEK